MTDQHTEDVRQKERCRTSGIEMRLTEVSAIVDVLLYVAEEAEEEERKRLRPSAISLLYIAGDKLHEAEAELVRLAS